MEGEKYENGENPHGSRERERESYTLENKKEKGSITVVVFATVTFILIILSTIYTSLIYKYKSQAIELQDLKEVYEMEGEEKIQKLYYELELKRNLLSGQGTKEDPYKIYTIEDLVKFSNRTNAGDTFEGQYVELMETLDFNEDSSYENPARIDYGDVNGDGTIDTLKTELTTGSGFPSISAREGNAFSGTFLGADNEIRNIYIDNSAEKASRGLFNYIGNCTIQNLGVTGNISTSVIANLGGIGGGKPNGCSCIIKQCYSKANISSSIAEYNIGGIIGSVREGPIIVQDCYNEGKLSGDYRTGGIIGYANSSEVKLKNCYNIGNITNEIGPMAGGLIGGDNSSAKIAITDSYNSGIVNGKANIGGVIGYVNGIVDVSDSYNTGNVTNELEKVSTSIFIGGIIGQSTSTGTANVTNCYNAGEISSKATYASNTINIGGIAGQMKNGKIEKCYNIEKVTGGDRSGGILGIANGENMAQSNVKIINSYNLAEIDASLLINEDAASKVGYTSRAGGIVGMPWYSNLDIVNCNNIGKVIARITGGILALSGHSKLNLINCYNLGEIVGTYVGGVSGQLGTDDSIANICNVYNIGNLQGTSRQVGIVYVGDEGDVKNNNSYFIDKVETGVTGITPDPATKMTESEMTDPSFAETLNNNLNSIHLSDYGLQDYTLSRWKAVTGSYPEFE